MLATLKCCFVNYKSSLYFPLVCVLSILWLNVHVLVNLPFKSQSKKTEADWESLVIILGDIKRAIKHKNKKFEWNVSLLSAPGNRSDASLESNWGGSHTYTQVLQKQCHQTFTSSAHPRIKPWIFTTVYSRLSGYKK